MDSPANPPLNKLHALWLAKPDPPTPPDTHTNVVPLTNGQTTPYTRRALENEVQAVVDAHEGTRNDTLNKAAFNLGTLITAGQLTQETVIQALTDAANTNGLTADDGPHAVAATIASGIAAGAQHPRVLPETTIPGPSIVETSPNGIRGHTEPSDDENSPSIEELLPIIDWHELWQREDTEEWILEPLLPARRSVALYSAPKVGKSLLMLEIAACLAQGTPILGITPDRPRRVLYVDFENDPQGDILTRLEAMDLGPDNLTNLCYMSFPTLAKLDTYMGGLQLVQAAQHYQCEVIIIDTVSRAVQGEENANDTWLDFYRHTGVTLKALGIACIRLDHTGKDKEKGMRGGSAKYGDVDAVWKLEIATTETLTLECVAHRMPIPQKILSLQRQNYPFRHVVLGTHWSDILDAQALEVDRELTRLGVPTTASVRECGRSLREAGYTASNAPLARAVKVRKMRLNVPAEELS